MEMYSRGAATDEATYRLTTIGGSTYATFFMSILLQSLSSVALLASRE